MLGLQGAQLSNPRRADIAEPEVTKPFWRHAQDKLCRPHLQMRGVLRPRKAINIGPVLGDVLEELQIGLDEPRFVLGPERRE